MGHALNHTMQDFIARYKRMTGHRVLWVPGTDHAGIATQAVVEADCLKRTGQSRHDMGREAFVDAIWQWKAQYGSRITTQIRTLGHSVDWSRERFTCDETLAKAVRHQFVSLYNQGLIYRDQAIINWCSHCQSALSDIEVSHIDTPGILWHIAYPLASGTGSITIATTRPETLLGDQAIAVHPDDTRYADLIGNYVQVPLCQRQIPIISDNAVLPDFGTGAVKVTPAHDAIDYAIGQRHQLDSPLILDEHGRITGNTPYDGLDRMVAREKILTDLGPMLTKITDYTVSQAQCYRCGCII